VTELGVEPDLEIRVRVRVVGEGRGPLAGIEVLELGAGRSWGRTDAEGVLEHRPTPAERAREWTLAVRGEGWTEETRILGPFGPGSRGVVTLELRLSERLALAGRIQRGPGVDSQAPVTVGAFSAGPNLADSVARGALLETKPLREERTDERDAYCFERLTRGPYRVAASLDGVHWVWSAPHEVSPPNPARVEDLLVVPGQPDAQLGLRFVDASGRALPGVDVAFRFEAGAGGHQSSAADGRLAIPGLTGERLEVEVLRPRTWQPPIEAAIGDDLEVVVHPRPGLRVRWSRPPEHASTPIVWRLCDGLGRALLTGMTSSSTSLLDWPPAATRLEVPAGGAWHAVAEALPTRPSEGEAELLVWLTPAD